MKASSDPASFSTVYFLLNLCGDEQGSLDYYYIYNAIYYNPIYCSI